MLQTRRFELVHSVWFLQEIILKLSERDSLKDCPFHVGNFIGSQVALEKEKGLPLSQRLTKLDENFEMVDATPFLGSHRNRRISWLCRISWLVS